jgi:hypothetical protein
MKVISNDGQEFEIDHDIAKQSTLLKQFSDGEYLDLFFYLCLLLSSYFIIEGADGPFPLPNVKGSILKPVSELFR